jgi:filamentous hemagglutinin
MIKDKTGTIIATWSSDKNGFVDGYGTYLGNKWDDVTSWYNKTFNPPPTAHVDTGTSSTVTTNDGVQTGTNTGTGSELVPEGKIRLENTYNPVSDSNIITVDQQPLGRGKSAGGHQPETLAEQLAVEQAISNPQAGRTLEIPMTDSRWPKEEGWVKKAQNINGVEVHYVSNTNTGEIDDFKIK